ncbi:MAG: peptidylprolyl isomerase [Anaerolineae bacterium]|nr:peptidylprolyl isomerase [Anaerolineae bacterium]
MSKRPPAKSAVQRARESRDRSQKQNQTITYIAAALAVVVILFIVWQVVSSRNSSGEIAANPTAQTRGACTGQPTPFGDGVRPLAEIPAPARNGYYAAAPETVIDQNNCYEAFIITNKGEIRLRLFEQVAPITVNNFVYLASQGFYDGVIFHRVLEGFMAQTGDPTGTGTGGPGYTFIDETDPNFLFDRRGLLAMANSGPATNGSQFFITFAPTDWLNGAHTIFGEIIGSDTILDAITRINPGDPAITPDVMEQVEILEYR